MATLSDLRAAIAGFIGQVLYPAGVPGGSNPSSPVAGCPVRVFQGWPERQALDADMAAGVVDVSVFVRPGSRNTSRYPAEDIVLSVGVPTLGWSIAGPVATVTGTATAPQNIGLILQGQAFLHAVEASDTVEAIAASLAAQVAAVTPATASGAAITIPAAGPIEGRVGGIGTSLREVGRQQVLLSIDIWAPGEALRNAVGAVVEPALRDLRRIPLADQSIAVTWFDQVVDEDRLEKADLYRRMMWLNAEYASTVTGAPAQILSFVETVTQTAQIP